MTCIHSSPPICPPSICRDFDVKQDLTWWKFLGRCRGPRALHNTVSFGSDISSFKNSVIADELERLQVTSWKNYRKLLVLISSIVCKMWLLLKSAVLNQKHAT